MLRCWRPSTTKRTFFVELESALTTWARYDAWLNTVPEKQEKPRSAFHSEKRPPLPDGGEHLLQLLFEIGPCQMVGMGGWAAISEQELLAWQVNQGLRLSGWECSTVRRLSAAYAHQRGISTDKNCPSPWFAPASHSEAHKAKIAERLAQEKARAGKMKKP